MAINLFQRDPLYNDIGDMNVSSFARNLAELAVWTGGAIGFIMYLYDKLGTTYWGCSTTGGADNYITGDFNKKLQAVVIAVTVSADRSTAGGDVTVNIDISDDNSNWTTVSTFTTVGANEQFHNYSGNHSFRYLRVHFDWNPGGAGSQYGSVYQIGVVKTE